MMKITTVAVKSNKIWVLASAIAVLICFALMQMRSVTAQEATGSAEAVKKFKITFPVSTLGNCASLEACKEYCEDSAHQEACTNFAKSKGFYKANQGQGNARSRLILEKAKAELGCTSEEDCKAFCKDEANRDVCREFAKKYKIEGAKREINQAVLEKARAALGCTDEESCKALCKDEANREKCSNFARQVGLPGGMIKIASMSGMNKDGFEQIKKIVEACKENPGDCEKNIAQIEQDLTRKSDEFCKQNPGKCNDLLKEIKEASRAGKFMPNSEKAFENANERAKFCREHPELCKSTTPSAAPDKRSLEKLKETEKKQFEVRRESEKKELELKKEEKKEKENNEKEDEKEDDDSEVQGASTSPSLFDRILEYLFK